jgi:hypothetical protein
MNIINFLKSGFNTNLGYTIIKRSYNYDGKPYVGYVLAKNYNIFWIPGYDRIGVFCDRETLDQYLELNSILITN